MEHDIQDRLRDIFRIERTAHHVCRILTEMKDLRRPLGEPAAYVLHLGKQVEHLTSFMPRYPQAQALLCGMDRQIFQRLEQDTLNGEQELNPTLKMDRQIDRDLRYYNGLLAVAPSLRRMLLRLINRVGTEQQSTVKEAEGTSNTETSEMVAQ